MNPNDRYAIIPLPSGPAPADALLVGGPLSSILENVPDSLARRDSIRTLQAARLDAAVITQAQKATRALQIAAFADSVNAISNRMDALEKRRAKRERQIAAQQDAEEQQQIKQMLDALPDPDDPPASHGHFNTGDLSPLPPTDDAEGDLPETLLRATPPPPDADEYDY